MIDQRVIGVPVQRVNGSAGRVERDLLAVEEPLEIRLGCTVAGHRTHRTVTVTMRTPGSDIELAVGFLFAEGVVETPQDIATIRHCGPPAGPLELRNVVRVDLRSGFIVDPKRLERNFMSTSSCGVCGKASLEALGLWRRSTLPDGFVIPAPAIHRMPGILRQAQAVFDQTGGLHAAALFDREGCLHDVCEDIGRHNAVDKLIGRQFLDGKIPLSDRLIFVSGRAGYELVQKSVAAGIPVLAAVGAPSSMALDIARESNMTLLGFVRGERFNIYSGSQRICDATADVPDGVLPAEVSSF